MTENTPDRTTDEAPSAVTEGRLPRMPEEDYARLRSSFLRFLERRPLWEPPSLTAGDDAQCITDVMR